MFECFSISCTDCTLKTFEILYACRTSQKIVWEVYVLEFCPKDMNEIYALDLFGYAISKRFTGVNMFGRCTYYNRFLQGTFSVYIAQHIFYETFWEIFQKRFFQIL